MNYDSARLVGVEAMPITRPKDGSTRLTDVAFGINLPEIGYLEGLC